MSVQSGSEFIPLLIVATVWLREIVADFVTTKHSSSVLGESHS